MKTFFHAFKLRDRTLVKDKERLKFLCGKVGNEIGEDEGGFEISSNSTLSCWFQKQASFLLLLTVCNTSNLLQIPHTVTFC